MIIGRKKDIRQMKEKKNEQQQQTKKSLVDSDENKVNFFFCKSMTYTKKNYRFLVYCSFS